jgi:hypothetical protein
LSGSTDKASYTPGESVSVTITGGHKGGWIRASLYDQSGSEVTRSGNGMSGNANNGYPITLTAPAPTAEGTYQWEVAWFGNMFDQGNMTTGSHGEERALTNSFDVAAAQVCTDNDGDGFTLEGQPCGTTVDCNDGSAQVFPGAGEDCTDGIDNDCDGLVDTQDPDAANCPIVCTDNDGDGYSIDGGQCGPVDCVDADASINPGAIESCTDGIDNNCNGLLDDLDPGAVGCGPNCTDADKDGFAIDGGSCGPVDCNDADALTSPNSPEICDGRDNNCDGAIDEGFDVDADGVSVCEGDCDDGDPLNFPGNAEVCDGQDNDCDGLVDDQDPGAALCKATCTDDDGDGFALEGGSCGPVDCNDADALINPNAVEECSDGIDNDCNGLSDFQDQGAVGCSVNCDDRDGDGYAGDGGPPPVDPPDGNHPKKWKEDHRKQASPSDADTCAACHQENFDQPPSCFNNTLCHGGEAEDDGGGAAVFAPSSFAPSPFALAPGECGPVDCSDGDPLVNPGAGENCTDGIDNDCNGLVDEADPVCAPELTDYDITKFKANGRKKKVGKKIKLSLHVRNRGPSTATTLVNVYGMQGQTRILIATDLQVTSARKKGKVKYKFTYYPDTAGEIVWHAEITDGNPDVDERTYTVMVKDKQ